MNYYFLFALLVIIILLLFIKFDNFENLNNKIPKIIYLSHKKKIPDFVIRNWSKLNPEYKINFYNDENCREFIKNNFSLSYLDYFDRLSSFKGSGPIKCDFWRCLILYKYGGIYADSDIELLFPIKNFLEIDTDFLTCISYFHNTLNPHFIICRPKNFILEKCIDIYVNEKFLLPYDYWNHSIVGIMKKAFNYYNINFNNNTNFLELNLENESKKKYKFQFLKEFLPYGNTQSSEAYCKYKNLKVLNNRYKSYNPNNHNFQANTNIIHQIKKYIFRFI